NGNIVPKKEYETTVLENGDSLEIVGFVGGG
ncbi:MAG: sulfur carrier protein ThiS, partial [Ruminococcus sp.]|nr:sulfur carrier protein ThiS [Ruminococcus sp.]